MFVYVLTIVRCNRLGSFNYLLGFQDGKPVSFLGSKIQETLYVMNIWSTGIAIISITPNGSKWEKLIFSQLNYTPTYFFIQLFVSTVSDSHA